MTLPERERIAEALISQALGDLASWVSPSPRKCVGPHSPQVFEDFEVRLAKFNANARAALGSGLYDGVLGFGSEPRLPALNPLLDRDGVLHHLADEILELQRTRPPWFAGGWSVNGRRPEWKHWDTSNRLTLEEAVLLLVDVDPRRASLEELFSRYGEHPFGDAVIYFLEDRYYELARGLDVDDDPEVTIIVETLFGWIARNDIEVPKEARSAFAQYFPKPSSKVDKDGAAGRGTAGDEELAHGHSINMFQRIIATMAVARFGMKSEKDAGRIAKQIEGEGLQLGFNPTRRRIRTHLLAGFKQISKEVQADLKN